MRCRKKGKPREVRGNVGGDGKEERRWREREETVIPKERGARRIAIMGR